MLPFLSNYTLMIRTSFLALAGAMAIASCTPFEDGSTFSLRPAKARVVGEWETTSITGDTTQTLAEFMDAGPFVLVLRDDETGEFRQEYTDGYIDGAQHTWTLDEARLDLDFVYEETGTWRFDIERLTAKEMRMVATDDNEMVQPGITFHLEKR